VPSVGYIVALPDEARSLSRQRAGFDEIVRLPDDHLLTISGTGPSHASQAAFRLVERGAAALVSWGCAGALAPDLAPGELLIPERIFGADGTEHAADADWHRHILATLGLTLPVGSGALAESREVVFEPVGKRALFDATGALAVDMESAAVARVAQAHRRPFLAVRAVADSAAMALPAAVRVALNPRGDVRLAKLLSYSLRHPVQFIELARLGRAFGAAMATLRRVHDIAGSDLRFPPPASGTPSP
jgi:adenosylhomocysteine nucleosidase